MNITYEHKTERLQCGNAETTFTLNIST